MVKLISQCVLTAYMQQKFLMSAFLHRALCRLQLKLIETQNDSKLLLFNLQCQITEQKNKANATQISVAPQHECGSESGHR